MKMGVHKKLLKGLDDLTNHVIDLNGDFAQIGGQEVKKKKDAPARRPPVQTQIAFV